MTPLNILHKANTTYDHDPLRSVSFQERDKDSARSSFNGTNE